MGNDLSKIKGLRDGLNLASQSGELSREDRVATVEAFSEGLSQDLKQCAIDQTHGPRYGDSFFAVCLNPKPEGVVEYLQSDDAIFNQTSEQRASSIKKRFGDRFDADTMACFTDTNSKEDIEFCADKAHENAEREKPLPPIDLDLSYLNGGMVSKEALSALEEEVFNHYNDHPGLLDQLDNDRRRLEAIVGYIEDNKIKGSQIIPGDFPVEKKTAIIAEMAERILSRLQFREQEEKVYYVPAQNESVDPWAYAVVAALEKVLGTDLLSRHISFPITPVALGVVVPPEVHRSNSVLLADLIKGILTFVPGHSAFELSLDTFSEGGGGVTQIVEKVVRQYYAIPFGHIRANDMAGAFRIPDSFEGALAVAVSNVLSQIQMGLSSTLTEVRGTATRTETINPSDTTCLDGTCEPGEEPAEPQSTVRTIASLFGFHFPDPTLAADAFVVMANETGAILTYQFSGLFEDGFWGRLGRGVTAGVGSILSGAFALKVIQRIRNEDPFTDYSRFNGSFGFSSVLDRLTGEAEIDEEKIRQGQLDRIVDLEYALYIGGGIHGAYHLMATDAYKPYASLASNMTARALFDAMGVRLDGKNLYYDNMAKRLADDTNTLRTSDFGRLVGNDIVDQYIYGRALTQLWSEAIKTEDAGNILVAGSTTAALGFSRYILMDKANQMKERGDLNADAFMTSAFGGTGALVLGAVLGIIPATRNNPGRQPSDPGFAWSDQSLGVAYRGEVSQFGDYGNQTVVSFDVLQGVNMGSMRDPHDPFAGRMGGSSIDAPITPIAALTISTDSFSFDSDD